jgi:hypothetical protein
MYNFGGFKNRDASFQLIVTLWHAGRGIEQAQANKLTKKKSARSETPKIDFKILVERAKLINFSKALPFLSLWLLSFS